MTFMPAQTFKLVDRGCLKPGMYADITIFDPEKIIDRGTFQDPSQFPEGIEYVIVNGKITVEKKIQTNERAGMVLRRS